MAVTIQIKRGAHASLPTLAAGEFGFETDTFDVYVGDGATNHKISSKNDFTDALDTKLDGIEASADVTDAVNVASSIHGVSDKAAPLAANDEFALIDSAASNVLKKVYWSTIKSYIDGVAIGIDLKNPVRVATAGVLPACTASGAGVGKTLTASAVGVLTVDGVATVLNDRILVKNQVEDIDNGIYKVTTAGTAGVAFILTRAIDADTDAEVTYGMLCFVREGTANGNEAWMLTTPDVIDVDVTELTFTQFSSIASTTTFIALTDTPANYTDAGLKVTRVNAGADALEFVAFAATYLDATEGGTHEEAGKAPTSGALYHHGIATTGVHGASGNTLLHSGSTIDGGAFV